MTLSDPAASPRAISPVPDPTPKVQVPSHDVAIRLDHVSKHYRLYDTPGDRVREAFHPLRRRYYHEFHALNDVCADIPRGATLGILGVNGSGKSTLLQIICGILQPSSGRVHVHGRIAALIELGAGFNPDLSGRANAEMNAIIMGLSPHEARERLPSIEAFADIGAFFEQPVRTYSSGMLMRVAFATAACVDPDILIIDEALAVGDARFQQKCFSRFRGFQEAGKTILFVTHDRHAVPRLCTLGMVLSDGVMVHFGDPKTATARYSQILMEGGTDSSAQPSGPAPDHESTLPMELRLEAETRPWQRTATDRDDRCRANPTYNANEHRVGVGGARIIDYRILDGTLENPTRVRSGRPLRLWIRIAFEERVECPIVGFSIKSTDGTLVFGMNSLWLEVPLEARSPGDIGEYEFTVRLDLAAGDWFFDLAVASTASDILDSRGGVVHLRVDAERFSTGIACLQTTLREAGQAD